MGGVNASYEDGRSVTGVMRVGVDGVGSRGESGGSGMEMVTLMTGQ